MTLPNIYQTKDEIIPNNQTEYEIKNEDTRYPTNINDKINYLLRKRKYIYKTYLEIKTKDKTIDKYVIGKTSRYLITDDNKLIEIKDIIDIKEKEI